LGTPVFTGFFPFVVHSILHVMICFMSCLATPYG